MILGIDPKVDYAFKRLFGSERTRDLLVHLLNAVLKPEPAGRVVEVTLLNPFTDKEALDDKLSILDIKARDQLGRQFNVEMQMAAHPLFFPKRLLYYWAKLFAQQLLEGEEYHRLRPTISICFVNGNLFPDQPSCPMRFRLWDTDQQVGFTDDMIVHVFEFPKFMRAVEDLSDPLDVWLYFLKHGKALDPWALPASLEVPWIHRAMEELTMLTQNEIERERYESRMKAKSDNATWTRMFQDLETELKEAKAALERTRKEGIEQALKQGLEQGLNQGLNQGLEQGLSQGLEKGLKQGLVEKVRLCQRLLRRAVNLESDLMLQSSEELKQLSEELERELSNRAL